MTEIINTQKRTNQYGGNYSSADYNKRVEENYQDLVYLYNKYNAIDAKVDESFVRISKDQIFLTRAIKDLIDRVSSLEAEEKTTSIHSFSQIDNARFASEGTFAIGTSEQLTFNSIYNYLTLPSISGSSVSVLKNHNSIGEQVIPDYLKFKVQPIASIDGTGAVINTTPPYYAVYDSHNRVWSRSVAVDQASVNGALMNFYIKVPQNTINQKVNTLTFSPYPTNSVDVISLEYTQKSNPILSDSDGWKPINEYSLYSNDPSAVGYVPPGGWSRATISDAILNSGPLHFHFNVSQSDNKPITAFKIVLRQRNYIKENNKYIYTYGLSDLDLRINKYLETGKAFIKFNAPTGSLIYTVDSVSPKIYNVPLSIMNTVFSYRAVYPTAAGGYSLSPQGGSSSIWIEVTLTKTENGTAPILNDLVVKYS